MGEAASLIKAVHSAGGVAADKFRQHFAGGWDVSFSDKLYKPGANKVDHTSASNMDLHAASDIALVKIATSCSYSRSLQKLAKQEFSDRGMQVL
jgi:hypothetical protein